MANSSTLGSGDGVRPTTDGGVDNLGAGKAFTPGKGDSESPAPKEKMSDNKKDVASTEQDDSVPFGLTQPAKTTPNTEPSSSNPGRSS